MPRAYSADLRRRVIEAVETGASRREAAELFVIDPSSAVRWLRCWNETGRCAPQPRRGSISPLEGFAEKLLALVAEQPDLTLEEIVVALRKRRIRTSKSAVSRFFQRHEITFKKTVWDGVAPVGVETSILYAGHGRERPSAFWWRSDPVKKHGPWAVAGLKVATPFGDPVLGN